ncbi:hypothetical protein [Micromonospora ureilytica]|uniref:hypothetical protein n=1 Tax=Micromonospora ureilytica TaxID=709868 RepID=UPI00403A05C5
MRARWLSVALVAGASMAMVPTVGAQAATSDKGDGNIQCGSGEICFQYTFRGNATTAAEAGVVRHFYNAAPNHAGDKFSNNANLVDNIQGYRNRDTECDVKMHDVKGNGAWFIYKSLPRTNYGSYYLYYDMGRADYSDTSNYNARDRNNGHTRCG